MYFQILHTVETLITGFGFSGPRFVWSLLESKNQLGFPRLADNKLPFTRLSLCSNFLHTSKQQCLGQMSK